VDLPSGGYIIIQPTEALTVIDVNSGSFTRSSTARETVLWTNCEAATEIARQLRLRNLAGVIIVDFIDMDTRRDQLQVIEHFNKALRSDKARPQISQLSELGLVELTRKRQGQNIYELFGRPCPQCAGLGHLVHLPDDSDDIDGESLERMGESRLSHRNSRKSSQPEEYRDGLGENTGAEDLGFGLEGMADGHPLDLMHHPSYQEKGGVNGRSRKKEGWKVGQGRLFLLDLKGFLKRVICFLPMKNCRFLTFERRNQSGLAYLVGKLSHPPRLSHWK
jgi:ribonuclease E